MDENQEDAGMGTIITAIAWVSKGYAKQVLDAYEPEEKFSKKQKKL